MIKCGDKFELIEEPKTKLAKKLLELSEKIIREGIPLLSFEEVEQEVNYRIYGKTDNSARYGRDDCYHKWVIRKDGYEEYCGAVICKECGAFSCECNKEVDISIKLNSYDNINGKWENPYVKKNN